MVSGGLGVVHLAILSGCVTKIEVEAVLEKCKEIMWGSRINVRIKSTAGTVMMWFLPMLMGGMGVLFLAIAAAIYFSSRQKAE
jgi:hypothetical protein